VLLWFPSQASIYDDDDDDDDTPMAGTQTFTYKLNGVQEHQGSGVSTTPAGSLSLKRTVHLDQRFSTHGHTRSRTIVKPHARARVHSLLRAS
jgi:hypothetical protein